MTKPRNCFFVIRCDHEYRDMIHRIAANRSVSASALVKRLIEDEFHQQLIEGFDMGVKIDPPAKAGGESNGPVV